MATYLLLMPTLLHILYRVVPVSEASVVIAVSAEHRKEAIEAVAFAIEVVKSVAAIWKKVLLQMLC